jgi:hypothetical protein
LVTFGFGNSFFAQETKNIIETDISSLVFFFVSSRHHVLKIAAPLDKTNPFKK